MLGPLHVIVGVPLALVLSSRLPSGVLPHEVGVALSRAVIVLEVAKVVLAEPVQPPAPVTVTL